MTRTVVLLVSAFFLGCGAAGDLRTAEEALSDDKADVCHRTGSGAVLRVNVSVNAVSAHLAHGDRLPYDVFPDRDGDGYGDAAAAPTSVCATPAGYVTDNTD